MSDDVKELVYSAARACAWGSRQRMLVDELLENDSVPVRFVPIPGLRSDAMVFGQCALPGPSWRKLRSRLIIAGFMIGKTKMWAPEAERKIWLEHPLLERTSE